MAKKKIHAGLMPQQSPDDFDPDELSRIIDDHDPALEPYASMDRAALVAEMDACHDINRWTFLREFLMDKFTAQELERENFLTKLATFLMEEKGVFGPQQTMHCMKVANEATRAMFEDMPPPARLHLVN